MSPDQSVDGDLGFKVGFVLAGFMGGVVSLAFIKTLTLRQSVFAVVVGCIAANYLTPAAVYWFNINPSLQGTTAFIVGLSAMSTIPIVIRAAAERLNSRVSSGDDAAKDAKP